MTLAEKTAWLARINLWPLGVNYSAGELHKIQSQTMSHYKSQTNKTKSWETIQWFDDSDIADKTTLTLHQLPDLMRSLKGYICQVCTLSSCSRSQVERGENVRCESDKKYCPRNQSIMPKMLFHFPKWSWKMSKYFRLVSSQISWELSNCIIRVKLEFLK